MTTDFSAALVTALPGLQRRARRLVAGSPTLQAEDLVQDTLVTALQAAHRFTGGHLAAWLGAILEGHAKNAARKARHRARVTLALDDLSAATGAPEARLELPVAANQETVLACADVFAVLATLSRQDQTLIRLARLEELSYAAIAHRLGLPLGTVQSRLSRALSRLRAASAAEPGRAPAARVSRPVRAAPRPAA